MNIIHRFKPKTYIQNIPLYRDLRAWSLFILCCGGSLLYAPQRLNSLSAYSVIRSVFTTDLWGVLFVVIGFVILIGIHMNAYKYVRVALVVASSLFTMWGLGYLIAFIVGSTSSPLVVVVYLFIARTAYSLLNRDPMINAELKRKP